MNYGTEKDDIVKCNNDTYDEFLKYMGMNSYNALVILFNKFVFNAKKRRTLWMHN